MCICVVCVSERDEFRAFYQAIEGKDKESKEDTIRIFLRQEYYTAHGENALLIADRYFHTRDLIK